MVNNPPHLTTGNTSSVATLLVVAPFEENARGIENHLRNAGHKVRTVWISELPALEQQLQRGQADLLFAADQTASMPLRSILESCRRFAPTLPVLVLTQRLSCENTLAAVAAGARDLVADGDRASLEHLEKVVLRELAAYRNLRELARSRAQLADHESRYSHLIAGTGDAVAHIYEGIVTQVNPAFAKRLGHEDVEALSGTPLMDLVVPEHQGQVRDHLKQLNAGRADGKTLECSLLCKDGSAAPVCAQLTRGEADGESFVEMLIRAEVINASTAAAAEEREAYFAAFDLPPVSPQPRAAMFVAVDASESLEERIGYLDFERVVYQAAALIRTRLKDGDTLYRFSTGEFAVLLSRPDANQFEALAAELVREVSRHVFSTADHEAQTTLTVAIYPLGDQQSAEQVNRELITQARRVSAAGGNKYLILGPTARAQAEEAADQRKAEEIRKAIDDNRLKLAYQTIASLEGESRQHFDVLVRMIGGDGSEIHAGEFIKTAERAGLMRAIDRWVVGRVFKVLATREPRKDRSTLFVKLSEDSLKDADVFLGWLQDLVRAQRPGPDDLCFEIPEMVLQNHIRKAKMLTKALRELGLGVAIEHFGVGTSSSQLIEHLPVNYLKFHVSYTHGFNDADMQRKMAGYMEQAKQRDIRTIVSHVEDANVMARMWQMGVNYIQGYHIQEPEVVMLT